MLTPAVTRFGGALALWAGLFVLDGAAQDYRLGVSGADPILVDFLAVDRNGGPIADLKPDEIVLKIDGRVRPVVSFQSVDFSEASGASPVAAIEGVPLPFGSNAVSASRSIVVLIDEESIRPGRERDTLAAVRDLVDGLPPAARVVIATPRTGWKTKLTSDRAETRRALSEIAGHASVTEDVECRTRVTLDAVRVSLATFVPEAAPTVLVISGGLAGPRQDLPAGSNGLARATGRVEVKPCDVRIEDFVKISDAVSNTRAHLSVIQPDDVAIATNMDQTAAVRIDLTAGLMNLAGVAGGKLLHLTPSSGNPLIAAVRESSSYYLAGFEPTAAEGGRSTHRVEIQVKRPRVTVIRRPELTIESAAPRPGLPAATTPAAMLRDPQTRRGFPMRMAGYASRGPEPAGRVQVIALAEPLSSASRFQSAAAGLFDAQGRLVSEWLSAAEGLGAGPILAGLAAPPGTYRLRVAAVDTSGRAGTVDYFLDATLAAAGPLRLSSLVLASMSEGVLRPALEFTSEPAAMASLEIYGERDGKPVAATFEVAESLNGPAELSIAANVEPTQQADRAIATAAIPIATLASGDYVVRVTVNLQNHSQGRVARTLRKR